MFLVIVILVNVAACIYSVRAQRLAWQRGYDMARSLYGPTDAELRQFEDFLRKGKR